MFRSLIFVILGGCVLLCLAWLGADARNTESLKVDTAGDLYYVQVSGQSDVLRLAEIDLDAVMKVTDGYLVLAGPDAARQLQTSGVRHRLLASGVDRDHLALDMRSDNANASRFPVVYEESGLRIFRVNQADRSGPNRVRGLAPIRTSHLRIAYKEPQDLAAKMGTFSPEVDLDSVISLVSQDSVLSYSLALQDMGGRTAGSAGVYRAVLWAENKFAEFGYDSVVVDPFIENFSGAKVLCHNVYAYKIGTTYPLTHIVVGAHVDAEPGSPGADDNGSGVVGVLEIARALANVETEMTIVFALFDAEEEGLLGSWYYADRAAAEGEGIAFMLDMDMIAFYRNTNQARLYYGSDQTYAILWKYLADSLEAISITGAMSGSSGGSDHVPFIANGYSAMFSIESIFSSVYHTARDSTTYMGFDYFTRMIKASLATTYYVDGTYTPEPEIFLSSPLGFPEVLLPGSPGTIQVKVVEYAGGVLLPGSVMFHYSLNGGPAVWEPMTDMGGGIFEAAFPPLECLDRIAYYVIAAEQTLGQIIYYPASGYPVQAIRAAAVIVALDDNFESDQGWTVSGNATDGQWERYRASSNASVPNVDYDGSGRCYLTDHGSAADVDNGTTSLTSPAVDVSYAEAVVEYARWFSNDLGYNAHSDVFTVYAYDGEQLNLLETVGPLDQAAGGWYAERLWLSDFFAPQSPVRFRFDASDTGFDSEVEAAVDAVRVTLYSAAPQILTEVLADGTEGESYTQQLDAVACAEPLQWTDKNGDLAGTGLTLSFDGAVSGVPAVNGFISFTALVTDAYGIPGEKTYTLHLWVPFLCGDANREGMINLADGVYIINYVFKGGPPPYPLEVADVNTDGGVNLADAVYMINYIFKGGAAPACP